MSISCEHIRQLKNGDHQVFKMIYDTWSGKVYYYFLQKNRDENIAKELTQQVFIKLWKYKESLSPELNIDQQLFQKARLIYIDWLRTEATKRKYFSGSPEDAPEIMVGPAQDLESQQYINNSLKTLPPKMRKVFELKHLHGFSYKEIAEQLGITTKTVDNHLLKATSHLKKVFNL